MRVAVVQNDPRFGQVESNLRAVEPLLTSERADLYVLPELFASGYLFTSAEEAASLAEPLDGPTFAWVHGWAKRLGAALCGGWPELDGETVYNSAMLVGPGGLLASYRKIHLFDAEKLHFAPGDRPFEVVEYGGVRMGTMICFDWRYPEAARSLALLGADLILHPSNLVMDVCPAAMITRALENNLYIATADRWGQEERGGARLEYFGSSQIVSPTGQILGRLGRGGNGILAREIDPAIARQKRVTERNDLLEDRRPGLYRN